MARLNALFPATALLEDDYDIDPTPHSPGLRDSIRFTVFEHLMSADPFSERQQQTIRMKLRCWCDAPGYDQARAALVRYIEECRKLEQACFIVMNGLERQARAKRVSRTKSTGRILAAALKSRGSQRHRKSKGTERPRRSKSRKHDHKSKRSKNDHRSKRSRHDRKPKGIEHSRKPKGSAHDPESRGSRHDHKSKRPRQDYKSKSSKQDRRSRRIDRPRKSKGPEHDFMSRGLKYLRKSPYRPRRKDPRNMPPLLRGVPGRELSGAKTDGASWAGDHTVPQILCYPSDLSNTQFHEHPLAKELNMSSREKAMLGLLIPRELKTRNF